MCVPRCPWRLPFDGTLQVTCFELPIDSQNRSICSRAVSLQNATATRRRGRVTREPASAAVVIPSAAGCGRRASDARRRGEACAENGFWLRVAVRNHSDDCLRVCCHHRLILSPFRPDPAELVALRRLQWLLLSFHSIQRVAPARCDDRRSVLPCVIALCVASLWPSIACDASHMSHVFDSAGRPNDAVGTQQERRDAQRRRALRNRWARQSRGGVESTIGSTDRDRPNSEPLIPVGRHWFSRGCRQELLRGVSLQ